MVLYCCIPYLDCGSSLRPTIFSYTSYTLILFKTFRYGTVLQNARIFFQIVFLDFLILPVFFTIYFNYLTILIWYLVAKFSFLLNMSVSARRFILQACQKPGTYVHTQSKYYKITTKSDKVCTSSSEIYEKIFCKEQFFRN